MVNQCTQQHIEVVRASGIDLSFAVVKSVLRCIADSLSMNVFCSLAYHLVFMIRPTVITFNANHCLMMLFIIYYRRVLFLPHAYYTCTRIPEFSSLDCEGTNQNVSAIN